MSSNSEGTSRGIPVTDETIGDLVEEAERGYDPETLKARGGRPLIGSAPAGVVAVRLDPELRSAVEEQAEADGTTASDVIRRAIRAYIDVA